MKLDDLLQFGVEAPASTSDLVAFSLHFTIIEYGEFCRGVREIARVHYRSKKSRAAEGKLLVAQTGGGKTTLLKYYRSKFPIEIDSGTTRARVVLVDAPEAPTVKSLAESILTALGDPFPHAGSAEQKTKRILHLFRKCKVELLMIDEFQHFHDGSHVRERKRITDWLKNLINRANVGVVLAGLPRSISVVNANPQLRRRLGVPHYIRPFGFTTEEERREFRAVLKEIWKLIPIKCIELHDANVARRFYYASSGLIDYIVKIVEEAVSRVSLQEKGAITLKTLERAFEARIWGDAPSSLNPFASKSKLRLLMQPSEPFDIWDDPKRYTTRGDAKTKTKGNHHASAHVQ